MKTIIIGIDGLEFEVIQRQIKELPNFKIILDKGILCKVDSVFPADSVPAWLTIFTGLNPAGHGIIRGKDYVESVEDYEKLHTFKLEAKSFWDYLSSRKKKCLVLNPFLAYPAWSINGLMISGPAFVKGNISIKPESHQTKNTNVYGGYSAVSSFVNLKQEMKNAVTDTKILWTEFITQYSKEEYDLAFVTFTTLDRIQHYSWRFYDETDEMHEIDSYLSSLIPNTIKLFDSFLGEVIETMKKDDNLVLISDHGFCKRPFNLINLNELLRQADLLKTNNEASKVSTFYKQKLKNIIVRFLSKTHLLDKVMSNVKKIPGISKYKKSDYLIDKENSICYVDELFSGKKPYVGLNFGSKLKNETLERRRHYYNLISNILNNHKDMPKLKWICLNIDLYKGDFENNLPDICIELPKEYGVEFELFGNLITTSSTHYKLSGGHYGSSTFGHYSPGGKFKKINSILDFHDFIISLYS
ncbi:MAG TPA: alkaline phosphatase family protein [Candidatus Paceibacterota bacterium]